MDRKKLIELHIDFIGWPGTIANMMTDDELVFDILKQLCERSDEHDGHAHLGGSLENQKNHNHNPDRFA